MFVLNDMPPAIDAERLTLLSRVETATVGHFLHDGFVDPQIQAVLPEKRVTGTAVTLRLPGADSTLLHHVMGLVRPGDVLVIDRAGDLRHACWGGVVTHAAKQAGVVAAIIDGPATDLGEIRRKEMPLWCRGPSPITTKLLGLSGALNVPVSCGGQVVEPGDAVLADESGVLVLKPDHIEAVAHRAIAMQDREVEVLTRISAGETLPAITGATAKIETAQQSQS